MTRAKIQEWITAFSKIAADRWKQRNNGNGSEILPIEIKACPREENCLQVRLGEIIDHVHCSGGDPYEVAGAVMQRLIPAPRRHVENEIQECFGQSPEAAARPARQGRTENGEGTIKNGTESLPSFSSECEPGGETAAPMSGVDRG